MVASSDKMLAGGCESAPRPSSSNGRLTPSPSGKCVLKRGLKLAIVVTLTKRGLLRAGHQWAAKRVNDDTARSVGGKRGGGGLGNIQEGRI